MNEKKQLVVLTHICYPIPSATGKIALQYSGYLKEKYDIRIIALQDKDHFLNGDDFDGIKVYTITQWRLKLAQKAEEKKKKTQGILSCFWQIIYFLMRALGRVQALLFTIDNLWWYKRKAVKQLEKLDRERKIDTILSISSPIETHLGAFEFKRHHTDVKWVCYWGDLFSTPTFKLNFFISIKHMKKIEKEIIEFSDLSLTTEEIWGILQERTINKNKIIAVPYSINELILTQKTLKQKYMSGIKSSKISFACIGSFYRKFRNPEIMLKIFSSPENDFFELALFTAGECQDIVDKYVKLAKGKIRHCGIIPYEDLIKKLSDADFLINVENNINYSNPSKLFELISYRKPIIDFSYGENSNPVLDKYPLALQINTYENQTVILNQIKKFVIFCKGKKISEEIIRNIYPENLESSIKELIKGKFDFYDELC